MGASHHLPRGVSCGPDAARLEPAEGRLRLKLPGLDIIIVNWNAGEQLAQCLASIHHSERQGVDLQRVVVVDNASRDGSADALTTTNLPLEVRRNDRNRGFAVACNQGAADSRADYLLFLNPDTRLFDGSLSRPVEFLEQPQGRDVGIVGVQLRDRHGHVSRSCARFPTPERFFTKMIGLDRIWPERYPNHFMVEWDHQSTREVDQVMGAFFLVRRSLFEQLRGFDERFFLYFEEVDFSLRARAAGWRTMFLSEAHAFHRERGVSEQVKAARLYYALSSRLLYGFKHFPRWQAWLLLAGTLLLEPWPRIAYAIVRRSGEVGDTVRAFGRLWGAVPHLIARQHLPVGP